MHDSWLAPQSGGVWPDNAPAVTAFLRVARQWRVYPNGRVGGLDYTAAEAGLRLAGITVDPDLWAGIQLVESGAVAAMNKD